MSGDRQSNSNKVLRRIGKKILVFLIIFVIPILLFIGIFHIKNVDVVGAGRYTTDQIKEYVFQSQPDTNSLYLYLKYKFFKEKPLPFIEKLEVEMVKPNSVKIYVYEKMIAGCVEFMGEYVYFDKDGMVVESSSEKLDKVPVIKGLEFNELILYQKLKIQKDEQYTVQSNVQNAVNSTDQNSGQKDEPTDEIINEQSDRIFNTIINLTQLINKYGLDVDTISFSNNYDVTFEIGDITVLLGKKDTYDDAVAELKNILKGTEGMKLRIDMRVKGPEGYIAKPKDSTE